MADVNIGAKLTIDANEAKNTVKQLRTDLKSAQSDVENLSVKYGKFSTEVAKATAKVNELKGKISEATKTSEMFDPAKNFNKSRTSILGLIGGFVALKGVMALVGISTDDLIQTFKGLFTKQDTELVKSYNAALEAYTKTAGSARQTVTEVKIAFEQFHAGVITQEQALKVYNDTLGDSLGRTNDLTTAEGILIDKGEAFIKITALKAQANTLFQISAQKAADALLGKEELLKDANKGGSAIERLFGVNQGYGKGVEFINQMHADSILLEKKGEEILRQAGKLSSDKKINTGTPTPTKSTGSKGGTKLTPKDKETVDSFEWMAQWLKDRENELLEEQLRLKDVHAKAEGEIDNNRFENSKNLSDLSAKVEENNSKAKIRFAEEEAAARIAAAQSVGYALGALSELVGRQTAAGKALGVAQAVINTWIGATEVLRAKTILPEPFGTIAKIANVAAIVASGMSAVKNIMKVQVPGGGGGGGSAATALAPLTPEASITNTLLNQNQLNQIGNAASRAFVVESDVTNNQERIRRLNRAARL